MEGGREAEGRRNSLSLATIRYDGHKKKLARCNERIAIDVNDDVNYDANVSEDRNASKKGGASIKLVRQIF